MTEGITQKSKYQVVIQSVNYYLLLLFVFWLPLKDDYLPLILALWIFSWLLEGNFKNRFRNFSNKEYYIGFVIYFLLTSIGLFGASNINDGFFEIQEKLSLVFFPVILLGSNQKVKSNVKNIFIVFIIGNLVAALYCIAYNIFSNIIYENGVYYLKYWVYEGYENQRFWKLITERCNVFSYSYLSVFKHPSYFSMYLVFSICFLIYSIKKKIFKNPFFKIASLSLILFFTFFIYLLQSRAGIISLILVFVLMPIIEIQKKFRKRYLVIIFSFVLFVGIMILPNSQILKTYTKSYKALTDPAGFSITKSDDRMQLWYTSIQIIKENFWFGTSPANLQEELINKYKELGFEEAAKVKLNTHNQYLETFAGLGIFGFLSLLFIFIYGFILSIKQKHYLLFFLLLILSINFFFESMLNRMAGILFMMFFISLFVFSTIPFIGQNKNHISNDIQ